MLLLKNRCYKCNVAEIVTFPVVQFTLQGLCDAAQLLSSCDLTIYRFWILDVTDNYVRVRRTEKASTLCWAIEH